MLATVVPRRPVHPPGLSLIQRSVGNHVVAGGNPSARAVHGPAEEEHWNARRYAGRWSIHRSQIRVTDCTHLGTGAHRPAEAADEGVRSVTIASAPQRPTGGMTVRLIKELPGGRQ